jgi:hypothetical protein
MAFRLAGAAATLTVIVLLAGVNDPSRPSVSASAQETVRLAAGATVALSTPAFLQEGKRYAFTWPGGGPPQTFTVKSIRQDGWILVEVAEENLDLSVLPVGVLPVRWLNAAIATSIQEMRPLPLAP